MEHGNGRAGVSAWPGTLRAGMMALGLVLMVPGVMRAQGKAKRDEQIHIVGLDSARTASLIACRRLQAYGQHVAGAKLKTLRETGVLAKSIDSLTGDLQRPNRYKEGLRTFLGLTTLPDSLQPVTAAAGVSCSPVPAQMVWQRLVQAELRRLPRFGIGLAPLNRQSAAAVGLSDTLGLLVQSVAPGYGAQAAGIVPGDVILSVDGKPVHSVAQFREVSAPWKNGDKVSVEVARKGGARQKISVEVRAKS